MYIYSLKLYIVTIIYFVLCKTCQGKLKDGTLVAIKVLSAESRQGVREFLTELVTISDIEHENLVEIYGCCMEGVHKILVYGYLENNSLAQTLLGIFLSNCDLKCLDYYYHRS